MQDICGRRTWICTQKINKKDLIFLQRWRYFLCGSQLIVPWVVTFFAAGAGFLLIGEMQNLTSKIGLGDAEK
jgi:hypothetical protein